MVKYKNFKIFIKSYIFILTKKTKKKIYGSPYSSRKRSNPITLEVGKKKMLFEHDFRTDYIRISPATQDRSWFYHNFSDYVGVLGDLIKKRP